MLAQKESVLPRLLESGLSAEQAQRKSPLLVESAKALLADGVSSGSEAIAYFVPGRIEVLGKHTDYAGGRSLTAAVEQGFCAIAAPRNDRTVRVIASGIPQPAEFQLEPSLAPTVGHWSNYPMTVARRIAQNFPGTLRGANLAFASDLPTAAGMSSSSALVIAIFNLLAEVNDLKQHEAYQQNIHNTLALASYQATIENGNSFGELAGDRGVGLLGGSEDHTAILCSQAGRLCQYSYLPTRVERTLTMPTEYLFAIASSGVVSEKTGAAMEKYNRASRLASTAAKVWREATGQNDPHLADAIRSSPEGIGLLRKILKNSNSPDFQADDLLERFEQFFAESEAILPAVPETLSEPHLAQFGELVDRSQSLAERLLRNQVPESIYLARSARDFGAAAASTFGAGYGGSVWAMVKKTEAESFLTRWKTSYATKFPAAANQASFFLTGAGPPAMKL